MTQMKEEWKKNKKKENSDIVSYNIQYIFKEIKSIIESDFNRASVIEEKNNYLGDWNEICHGKSNYQRLLMVQIHKCIGSYCIRMNKNSR